MDIYVNKNVQQVNMPINLAEPVNLVMLLAKLVLVVKLGNVLHVNLLFSIMKEDVELHVQTDILEEKLKEIENVILVTLLV
jgi:hypothetical protein